MSELSTTISPGCVRAQIFRALHKVQKRSLKKSLARHPGSRLESGMASTHATANATVTIHDQPIDAWRFSHFTAAELGNPAVSGDLVETMIDLRLK